MNVVSKRFIPAFYFLFVTLLLSINCYAVTFEIYQLSETGRNPSAYDGTVAWVEGGVTYSGAIFFWNGTDVIRVTNDYSTPSSPSLYDGTIAWTDSDPEAGVLGSIFYWNGTDTIKAVDSVYVFVGPYLFDGGIAWLGAKAGENAGIFYWNGSEITKGPINTGMNISFYNDTVAWIDADSETGQGSIFYWDGTNTIEVAANIEDLRSLSLYDGTIAWVKGSWTGAGEIPSLWYWDGTEAVEVAKDVNDSLCLYDGTIVFTRYGGGPAETIFYWDGEEITEVAYGSNPSLHKNTMAWQDPFDGGIFYAKIIKQVDSDGTSSGGDGGGGGCFIATAAYESPMQPYVKILCEFRDRFLLKSRFGKAFVNFYCKYSPSIADFIANHDSLKTIIRLSLLPFIGVSWLVLKIGPVSTMALTLFFAFGLISFIRERKKFNR